MAKDPAFLFYPQDFIMGTMHFSNEQIGIYIKLLCFQHQHGGIIDRETFCSFTGEHKIIERKFVSTPDGFYNARLLMEMTQREKKSSNLSENAKKRWSESMQKKCKSNAIASDLHMPIEDEDESENEVVDKKVFEEIWSKYPNKDGKIQAIRYFNSSVKTEEDVKNIRQALNNYIVSENVQKGFIKNGSTWFHNWRDWITPPKVVPTKPKEKYDPYAGYTKEQRETLERRRKGEPEPEVSEEQRQENLRLIAEFKSRVGGKV